VRLDGEREIIPSIDCNRYNFYFSPQSFLSKEPLLQSPLEMSRKINLFAVSFLASPKKYYLLSELSFMHVAA
jgi:hypothetical protein